MSDSSSYGITYEAFFYVLLPRHPSHSLRTAESSISCFMTRQSKSVAFYFFAFGSTRFTSWFMQLPGTALCSSFVNLSRALSPEIVLFEERGHVSAGRYQQNLICIIAVHDITTAELT